MKTTDITIRHAVPNDAEALLAIYAPYVQNTAITFELDIPTISEFQKVVISNSPVYICKSYELN